MHIEHVIPQCLGVFKNNLTLTELVCNDCNQFFGDNLELALGRDSLEGIARYRFGIGPQKVPFFKRICLKVEGPQQVKGVHVIPKLPGGKASHDIQAVSQVGFFSPSTGEYEYFTMAEVPSKVELEEKGLLSSSRPIIFYGEPKELLEGLKGKGIDIRITEIKEEHVDMPPAMVPVRVRARIDAILLTCPP